MTTNIKPKNKNAFDRNSWATPQYLFYWLNYDWDFEIDLCADRYNYKCDRWIGIEDDSLTEDWHKLASIGFCNPPYSNIKPWVKKAVIEARQGFTTIMLIPTPNGESYYKDIFNNANSITFINGRIAFYNPKEQKYISGNTRGSCVVEFGGGINSSKIVINNVDRNEIMESFNE